MSIFIKIFYYLIIGIGIFLIARIGIFLVHYQNFSSLSLSNVILAFLYGFRFDLASLLVFSGIPLLLMALPFHWCTSKWWHVTLSSIVFFVFVLEGTLLIGDVIYFGYVKRHLTNELLFLGKDIKYLISEATANPGYLAVWFGTVSLGLLYWLRLCKIRVVMADMHWAKFIIFFVFVVIAGRGGIGMKPLAIVHAFSSGNSSFGHLVLNGVFSASHSSLSPPVDRLSISNSQITKTLNLPNDFWNRTFPLSKNIVSTYGQKNNLIVLFVKFPLQADRNPFPFLARP